MVGEAISLRLGDESSPVSGGRYDIERWLSLALLILALMPIWTEYIDEVFFYERELRFCNEATLPLSCV
jgi:hypothetical protein